MANQAGLHRKVWSSSEKRYMDTTVRAGTLKLKLTVTALRRMVKQEAQEARNSCLSCLTKCL